MNRTRSVLLGLCIGCVSSGIGVAGDANGLTVTVTGDLYSKYIWRGQNLNDGAVFQPSVSAGACGFTGTVWGSFDLTDENTQQNEFTEVDLWLDYSGDVPGMGVLNFSAGALHYRFPNTPFPPTVEVYAGVGLNCTCEEDQRGLCLSCLCDPSVSVYWDIDQIQGAYVQMAIGHTFSKVLRFSEGAGCDAVVGVSLGLADESYNEGYLGVDKSGVNDLTASVSLPLVMGRWTLRPTVGYATLLDSRIRDATAQSDNLWAGVSASLAIGR